MPHPFDFSDPPPRPRSRRRIEDIEADLDRAQGRHRWGLVIFLASGFATPILFLWFLEQHKDLLVASAFGAVPLAASLVGMVQAIYYHREANRLHRTLADARRR